MATRRRIVRPVADPFPNAQQQRRIAKLRARLEKDRVALARWQTRLRRAFTTVEKHQRSIARLEKQLRTLDGA